MSPEECRRCLQRPYPMVLIHPEHGERVSCNLFEQNELLTSGWKEAPPDRDYWRAARSEVYRQSLLSGLEK